jgi:hypothetical protein
MQNSSDTNKNTLLKRWHFTIISIGRCRIQPQTGPTGHSASGPAPFPEGNLAPIVGKGESCFVEIYPERV